MDGKWYVSLGGRQFVVMDERPYVFYATQEQVNTLFERLEKISGSLDCQDDDFPTHIHVKELVMESHWADHTDVNEERIEQHGENSSPSTN